MDEKTEKSLWKLKKGSRIKVNGKAYAVKSRFFEKAHAEYHSDVLFYDFGDDYYLQNEWGKWWFFHNITKKRFLGFTTTTSKTIQMKNVKILKK